MATKVAHLLAHKGDLVHTVEPDATVEGAAELMDRHGVGALVVSPNGRRLVGIVSERDIVRRVAREGAPALSLLVDAVMTGDVVTCTTTTSVDELAALMTARRVRHIPVVEDRQLLGLVSIGDVVRARMDELATERDELQAYVAGSY
ncbi:MAG: CBS domain-containing protein [Nitriliruptoraceae bacterium]|nr:CBS domain-containing protein [Nitriliruptoraceae bacterium]